MDRPLRRRAELCAFLPYSLSHLRLVPSVSAYHAPAPGSTSTRWNRGGCGVVARLSSLGKVRRAISAYARNPVRHEQPSAAKLAARLLVAHVIWGAGQTCHRGGQLGNMLAMIGHPQPRQIGAWGPESEWKPALETGKAGVVSNPDGIDFADPEDDNPPRAHRVTCSG